MKYVVVARTSKWDDPVPFNQQIIKEFNTKDEAASYVEQYIEAVAPDSDWQKVHGESDLWAGSRGHLAFTLSVEEKGE